MKTKLIVKNGKPCWMATLGIRDGKWRRKFFPVDPLDPEQAEKDALAEVKRAKADRKETGNQWLDLPAVERAEVMRVLQEMREAGLTLRGVWEAHQERKAPHAQTLTLEKAVVEFIESRKGCSAEYLKGLGWILNPFAAGRGSESLSNIDRASIEGYIEASEGQVEHKNTILSRLRTFFAWAMERGYIAANPTVGIRPIKFSRPTPKIFTIDQCRLLLESSKKDKTTMPTIVLGLFCGVRPFEVARMRRLDIQGKNAILGPHVTKTSQRRIVPIPANAVEWLQLCKPWNFKPLRKHLDKVCSVVPWSHDVMRHTAASMLLAREQDAAKVALWLGNSPGVLFQHYRELVKREVADEFFRIRPTVEPF